jgi:hypothetical protein
LTVVLLFTVMVPTPSRMPAKASFGEPYVGRLPSTVP